MSLYNLNTYWKAFDKVGLLRKRKLTPHTDETPLIYNKVEDNIKLSSNAIHTNTYSDQ